MIPLKPGMSFALCEKDLRQAFLQNDEDSEEVKEYKQDANMIIDQAKIVEGVFINYGIHAAGVIIADGNPIDDYVPLMRDEKSGDMKVQCDMVQAEEVHGLLKFDFLGLRNLKIVTMTLRSIKKRTGIEIDVEHIPFEKEVFESIFMTGRTGSVFQFESAGMKQMLRKAKPDCLEDLIALVSLYRPGPMDSIPKYIENKMNPDKITYLCEELRPILSKTYGCIVYQEQVMEIVQKLAGFSLSQADNVRRFMSKKKMEKLEHEREAFIYGDESRKIDGCIKRGISKEVAETIFNQMVEFAKYAFNKSHAAAYAVLSYITAYLKHHFPADYMCAVLNCTEDIKKMPSVLNDCREINVKVLPPDINKSEIGFSVYDKNILFGLNSVKGTKIAYAMSIIKDREINGNYLSFKEFMKRNVADKSTTENLIKAGAMDEFGDNRYAMLKAYEEGSELIKSIIDKRKDIEEKEQEDEEKKATKRYQTSLLKAKNTLEMLEKQYDILRVIDTSEDHSMRMLAEKEVLGLFISEHPLNNYGNSGDLGCTPINELEVKDKKEEVAIMGIIQNYKETKRKADGKPMAFFDIEDKTGIIHVCCFTQQFKKSFEYLGEDKIVKLFGFADLEDDNNNDNNDEDKDNEPTLQFIMNRASELKPDLEEIKIFIPSIIEWNGILEQIKNKKYITTEGHPLRIYDQLNGEYRKTKFYVKEEILSDGTFCVK